MSTSGTASASASAIPTVARVPLRLGERLLQMGLVSADQIQIALLEQNRTGKQLGDALIAMGFVTEEVEREVERLCSARVPFDAVFASSDLMAMTVIGTALQPALWLHPLGPLLKNLPIAAMLWFLLQAHNSSHRLES